MSDNMNIQQTVGDNIRKFRQARGMTMEDLAARIYKGKSTISKLINGLLLPDKDSGSVITVSGMNLNSENN